MTQAASPASEPHRSRYHVATPPANLYSILSAFAKETRGAVYKRHGGYPDNTTIRSIITGASKITTGDADDVGRFLKKEGVLKDAFENRGWTFDPEAADKLFLACCQSDQSLVRGGKSFVEMCERSSDPGAAPAIPAPIVTLVGPSTGVELKQPAHDFRSFDDELLELQHVELVKTRADLEAKLVENAVDLEAVTKEQTRRATKARIVAELAADEARLAEVEKAIAEKRKQLESFTG